MIFRGICVALLVGASVSLASIARAQSFFLPEGEGDWFDPANWSTGQVPSVGSTEEDAWIEDGIARASGTSPFFPGSGPGPHLLVVGTYAGASDASSSLITDGLDLSLDELEVAALSEGPIHGAIHVDGSIFLKESIAIAGSYGFGTPGQAVGRLHVEGSIIRPLAPGRSRFGFIDVGYSAGLVEPNGHAFIRGDISRLSNALVGGAGPSDATGYLEVGGNLDLEQAFEAGPDQTVTSPGELSAGLTFDNGNATGMVIIGGDMRGSFRVGVVERPRAGRRTSRWLGHRVRAHARWRRSQKRRQS